MLDRVARVMLNAVQQQVDSEPIEASKTVAASA